ncbi:MAG: S41 family peptidase, partial [Phototrophicaceae bacterium]
IIVLVAVSFQIGLNWGQRGLLQAGQVSLSQEEEQAFQAFWETYQLIQEDYLDPIETDMLVEGAIAGMVESLGDQYSGYMSREAYSLMSEDLSGEIQGIGVIIHTIMELNAIEVANVLKDTPAEKAGVQVGDIFLQVNGEDVIGVNQLELASLVRGPVGTTVDITFLRGEEQIEMTIERAAIPVPTTEYVVLEDNIGYIRMYDFNDNSRPQIDEAVTAMSGNNLNGLILDLRGNPGGTLTSAIQVSSAFIEDDVVLRREFADDHEEVHQADGSYAGYTFPLVVLVNGQSASASELVAGALQDHELATIVGEVTFGKGTVQILHTLGNGGGVRLTIARWLTPNGNWIHEQGVTPDVVVEWALEDRYYTNITDAESVAGDPQLQAALNVLQGEPMGTN